METALEVKQELEERISQGKDQVKTERTLQTQQKIKNKEEASTHNSLQHDPRISVQLLSILIDALKKEKKDEDSLETKAEEETEISEEESDKKEKKDPILALAERIKQMYARELVQESYAAAVNNYSLGSEGYHQAGAIAIQKSIKQEYEQNEDTFEKKKSDIQERIKEENSKAYKLNRDSKYQANVMSDPRGRLVSTWTFVRSINETSDGKITANDGYISQGF